MSQKITAGDSYTLPISAPYLADDGWVLTYVLQPRGFSATPITIVATADGSDYVVEITAVASALYTPGEYDAFGFVTKGAERHTVLRGRLTIEPNPTSAADRRSWLEKTIAVLEASLAGLLGAQYSSMTILGKSLGTMSPVEKKKLRDELKAEYAQELRSKNGITRYGRMIQCGFVQAGGRVEATPDVNQSTFTP